jgi:tripartite-type tricarboxylate transporter receptor subunit TctC
MLKKLMLAAAATVTMGINEPMAQTSVGKPTVPVYTKFSIGGEPGRMIFDLVRRMNEMDPTRDYRFAHMPGAGGEIALGRAVIDARAGKEVLIFESNPPFTFDLDKPLPNSAVKYDKLTDFKFVLGHGLTEFAVMSPTVHGIKSVDQLVKFIRESKTPQFYADYVDSKPTTVLTQAFIAHYGLQDKMKPITYSNPTDTEHGAVVGEYIINIAQPGSFGSNSNILAMTGTKRSRPWANVPTVKEVGLPELEYISQTFFAVPKENEEFGKKMAVMIQKICDMPDYVDMWHKFNRELDCVPAEEVARRLETERKMIGTYSSFLK